MFFFNTPQQYWKLILILRILSETILFCEKNFNYWNTLKTIRWPSYTHILWIWWRRRRGGDSYFQISSFFIFSGVEIFLKTHFSTPPPTHFIKSVILKICTICNSCIVLKYFNLSPIRKQLKTSLRPWFSNPYIFTAWCCRPLLIQSKNSGRLKSQSFKYQRFATLGCKDIGIIRLESGARDQLLWKTSHF